MSNNKLLDTLKEKFDIIYVLSLVNRNDRREMMERQFDAMGLPRPDTTPFIRYYYATPFPFNNIIAEAFVKSNVGMFTKPNEYDCSRNHYAMVKICQGLGYKHCLIMEDDLLFRKNTDEIIEYLNNIPSDYDIIQFGGFTADKKIHDYIKNPSENAYWTKHKDVGVWNASMYALSRKGMSYYLTFMDKIKFWVADGPTYKAPLNDSIINTYLSTQPIVIQADKDVVASDIRDEKNDSIDYNTQNEYERDINKNEYFAQTYNNER